MKNTTFAIISIISLIIAVGCIDGPVGYENDNWIGCFIFATIGIISGILSLKTQEA
jgi:hypothetical protein